MGEQLKELAALGQSIWIDYIRRNMFGSGELRRLIDLGLRGMTSNPTIFEKAIGAGDDYDEQLRSLIGTEQDPADLFEALAIDDIRRACDEFRGVYDETEGADGFVSLEVSPLLANDTEGTIAAAARLWKAVDRPNVMIKIPGTAAGIPAIRASIAAGININVTLIFSLDHYTAAAQAYIEGIEDRIARGEPVERVASVNSVFVSRIDTAVDKLLEAKIAKGEKVEELLGKTALANLKLQYQRYLEIFEGERFAKAKAAGARVQRPLWASTSTKNPRYPDLLYVENAVARNTVNTLPPATLEALLDHGRIRPDTILEGIDQAKDVLARLAQVGISLYDVTAQLQLEAVKLFTDSYNAVLAAIRYKRKALADDTHIRVTTRLGKARAESEAALETLVERDFLKKMWRKDPTPWSTDPAHTALIKNALGWLDIPEKEQEQALELKRFAEEQAKRFKHVVVLGMGGSSLAPDILRETFGRTPGYPQLHVLDSTAPAYVKALEDGLDIPNTLFIVASKSGTTTEPDAFYRYFYERVQKAMGGRNAADHFIAITDPGTALDLEAKRVGFLRIFPGTPDIGGRYSALSNFGMVPAALAGYDIATILDRAIGTQLANAATTDPRNAPGLKFGAAIGGPAKNGKNKLTIVAHPMVRAFGAWAEQLIAESTGKSGRGIVPVVGEPLGPPAVYGDDRIFVYVGEGLPGADERDEAALKALEDAGHPVIRLSMTDPYDIGEQFYTWEIATAAAGAILGIDPFDQPNVQESKDNTKRLLEEFARCGSFSEPAAAFTVDDVAVVPLAGSRSAQLGRDLASTLGAIFGQIKPGDYVAFNAYIPMTQAYQSMLRELRTKVRDAYKVATTVGFGPRFLHSTGQLHKGGPPIGIFIQIDGEPPFDLPIPGMPGFKTLIHAQALGDFQSLDKRALRGARLHVGGDLDAGLRKIAAAIEEAVGTAVGSRG
jgi:transaldolase/glucose-6-phosphate isomerase